MGQTNGNRHPADAHSQRVSRQEPAPVQRFNFDTRFKAKATQTMTLSLAKLRPVHIHDPRDPIQRQCVQLHPTS
jgi:hypothetical protein